MYLKLPFSTEILDPFHATGLLRYHLFSGGIKRAQWHEKSQRLLSALSLIFIIDPLHMGLVFNLGQEWIKYKLWKSAFKKIALSPLNK